MIEQKHGLAASRADSNFGVGAGRSVRKGGLRPSLRAPAPGATNLMDVSALAELAGFGPARYSPAANFPFVSQPARAGPRNPPLDSVSRVALQALNRGSRFR